MNDLNAMPDFDAAIAQATATKTTQDEQSKTFDERYVSFKPGKNYRFRLCWPVDPSGTRKFPFIFRLAHVDGGEEGREYAEVTCPTSDYILGKAGYNQCPVCTEVSAFWDDYAKTKSAVSKELYDHFKRKNRNTAMVYVVNDDNEPKNNGTFKFIYVVPQVADFLRRKIFGWAVKKGEAPLPPDQIIGKEAFLCDAGYDLSISVSFDGQYNQYAPEFLPKPTKIPVTQADINKAGVEMKFDEDLYKVGSMAERQEFVKTRILQVKMHIELNGSTTASADPMAGIDPNNAVAKTANAAPKNVAPAQQPVSSSELDDIINGIGSI